MNTKDIYVCPPEEIENLQDQLHDFITKFLKASQRGRTRTIKLSASEISRLVQRLEEAIMSEYQHGALFGGFEAQRAATYALAAAQGEKFLEALNNWLQFNPEPAVDLEAIKNHIDLAKKQAKGPNPSPRKRGRPDKDNLQSFISSMCWIYWGAFQDTPSVSNANIEGKNSPFHNFCEGIIGIIGEKALIPSSTLQRYIKKWRADRKTYSISFKGMTYEEFAGSLDDDYTEASD